MVLGSKNGLMWRQQQHTTCVARVATSLAYEQDRNRRYFEIDLPLSIPIQQAAAANTCRMGRDVVRVAVYQSNTMSRRIVRFGALRYGLWLAQNSPKQFKARQSRQNQVNPAISSQKRDVRLANLRAPGVWFVLGLRMYLFLAPKWPSIPVFGKNP